MKRHFLSILALAMLPVASAFAQAGFDTQQPFGFVLMASRTDAASTYKFTGGGVKTPEEAETFTGSKIVLTSTGADMTTEITNAIKKNSVIIFDGSNGDFIIKKTIAISTSGRTLIGINGATLASQWHATAEDIQALEDAGVSGMSTSGGGGTLSNGTVVKEQAEYNTRQIMINRYNDQSEWWRNSGIFYVTGWNIIFRNLKFQGPGSMDLGGSDLVSIYGAKHIWIDHCEFRDGQDGNMDITQMADFCTISWCTFSYTDRSYMHQNTNLVGSSDSETQGYLNTTWAYNIWGAKCRARMPMARVGKIHMLNNYYNCAGNVTACINPRKNSEFLIDGNYFEKDVTKVFSQSDALAYVWQPTNIIANTSVAVPESSGSVSVPYTYEVQDASILPEALTKYSGATIFSSSSSISAVSANDGTVANDIHYNTLGQQINHSAKGIHITKRGKFIVR